MKILVVDDSKVMRKLIVRTLRQAGHGHAEIVEAGDGLEALTVAEDEEPDLILADWNMPNMTGIEMLEALRAKGDSVRVGFITSESTAEVRALATNTGASFLLTKPVNPESLEEALDGVGV